MKKIRYNTSIMQVVTVSLLMLVAGCKKDETGVFQLTRMFAPSAVTTTLAQTSVKVSWPASLFSDPYDPNMSYVVEFSKTLDFATIAYTVTTGALTVTATENNISVRTNYYARVKALGTKGATDSNYVVSAVFAMTGEQFMTPIPATDATDVAILVKWTTNPYTFTKIVATPVGTGTPVEVALSAPDLAAFQKVAPGLTQNTTYSVEIFEGTKSKGIQTIKTRPSITGNIVDISATTGDVNAMNTAMTSAPSGSVILLRRGETYHYGTAPTPLLSKSVTIMSAYGFGTNYAQLRSLGQFNLAAGSPTIDSIVFRDLIFKGRNTVTAPLSYGTHYIMNASATGTIVKVRLDNCVIKLLRGVVRAQTGTTGTIINNYFVNNCVVDSIADFSIVQVSAASRFDNVKITNSTFYRIRKLVNHGTSASTSVLIENCTINEAPSNNGTNFIVDYNTFNVSGGITIRNCIFGNIWTDGVGPATNYNGYRAGTGTALSIVTCYATSDFVLGANPLTGTTPYAGASTSLFNNVAANDFTIKDTSFPGRNTTGDPRWRIP